MAIPSSVLRWCGEHGHGAVVAVEPVGGGCINDARRLRCADGRTVFLKTNPRAPAGVFAAEAAGLAALRVPDGPRVPEVLHVDDGCILLEDLAPGAKRRGYWEDFGRRLARLHRHEGPTYGFTCDTWCGEIVQPNTPCLDGHAFFAEQRLRHQLRIARERGGLGAADTARIERVCARLPELVPAQPPSIIHGDLWSGNAHVDPEGAPALIDPAASWCWAEADLAMTALFGGFPAAFYDAYVEERPLPDGWRERFDIYNLYHLLNHLNHFGGSYLEQVARVAARYGS